MDLPAPEHDPLAPPTEPVGVRPVPLSTTWPTFLGVVSIVLGVIAFLQGCMAALAPIWMKMVKDVAPKTQVHMFGVMEKWETWTVCSGAFSVLLAILLIIGGAGIAFRRRWGVKTQLTWAVLKILWTPAIMGVGLLMQMEQLQASRADMANTNAPAPAIAMAGAMEATTYIMTGLMALWLLLLPIVSLVWLLSSRARREIRTWEQPGEDLQAPS